MDIRYGGKWPASALSNFAPHSFEVDGVYCASMEGFLQSLKFEDSGLQQDICAMDGLVAKKNGKNQDVIWKATQRLWWKGLSYKRASPAFQDLITQAYDALSKNEGFCKALRSTGTEQLTHSIGKTDPKDTCLTEAEFCAQLVRIRNRLS